MLEIIIITLKDRTMSRIKQKTLIFVLLFSVFQKATAF